MQVQRVVSSLLSEYFTGDGLIYRCLDYAANLEHIMDFTRLRALNSLFSMLNQAVRTILNFNHTHLDFPMPAEQMESYILKWLVYAVLWSFTGDSKTKERYQMGDFIKSITTITLPDAVNAPILDFQVKPPLFFPFLKKDVLRFLFSLGVDRGRLGPLGFSGASDGG